MTRLVGEDERNITLLADPVDVRRRYDSMLPVVTPRQQRSSLRVVFDAIIWLPALLMLFVVDALRWWLCSGFESAARRMRITAGRVWQ